MQYANIIEVQCEQRRRRQRAHLLWPPYV